MKDVAYSLMPVIEILGILRLNGMKNLRQGSASACSQEKMDMVRHQSVTEKFKGLFGFVGSKELQISLMVNVVTEDRLAVIPAGCDVMYHAWNADAMSSAHE